MVGGLEYFYGFPGRSTPRTMSSLFLTQEVLPSKSKPAAVSFLQQRSGPVSFRRPSGDSLIPILFFFARRSTSIPLAVDDFQEASHGPPFLVRGLFLTGARFSGG